MAFLLILIQSFTHPFHVSVTNIYYKEQEKVVQVEQRIFLDDFEEALRDYAGNQKFNITEDDPNVVKKLMSEYLSEKFRIEVKGKPLEFRYIGNEMELEENVMWCYWEAEKVRKFDEFRVVNTVLTEKFSDQENIVHYKHPNGTKSQRTGIGKPFANFSN